MSADVEHHDGVVLGIVQVILEAFKVEALCLLAKVTIVLLLVANEVGNSPVDGPG